MPLNPRNTRVFYRRLYTWFLSATFHHNSMAPGAREITATQYSIPVRKKRIHTSGEILIDGITGGFDTVFQVYDIDLDAAGAPAPFVQDYILVGSERYLILRVVEQLFGNVYNLFVRRVA